MELPPLRCVKKLYIFFEPPFLEESIDIYIVPKNIAPWPLATGHSCHFTEKYI
jgi:hypothetical protein